MTVDLSKLKAANLARWNAASVKPELAHFIDGVKLDARVRDDICFNNAARLLKLPK